MKGEAEKTGIKSDENVSAMIAEMPADPEQGRCFWERLLG